MDYPLPSVLKKVSVEHISGNATYWDGAPLGVKLTLDFAEVFELDRNKYDERVAAYTNLEGDKRETSQERGSYNDLMGLEVDNAKFVNGVRITPISERLERRGEGRSGAGRVYTEPPPLADQPGHWAAKMADRPWSGIGAVNRPRKD